MDSILDSVSDLIWKSYLQSLPIVARSNGWICLKFCQKCQNSNISNFFWFAKLKYDLTPFHVVRSMRSPIKSKPLDICLSLMRQNRAIKLNVTMNKLNNFQHLLLVCTPSVLLLGGNVHPIWIWSKSCVLAHCSSILAFGPCRKYWMLTWMTANWGILLESMPLRRKKVYLTRNK